MENEMQGTANAQKIFTWEQFENSRNFGFPKLELTVQDLNNQVLHRVIERGGNQSGAKRGVLFAQDFGLDINVPVAYAIDWNDPHLHDFLEPLIPQLNLDTICPVNYFSRNSDNLKNVEEVRLGEVLSKLLVRRLQKKNRVNVPA